MHVFIIHERSNVRYFIRTDRTRIMANEQSFTGYRGTSFQMKLVPCSDTSDDFDQNEDFSEKTSSLKINAKMERLVSLKSSSAFKKINISILILSLMYTLTNISFH